jgi:hypothetical protein
LTTTRFLLIIDIPIIDKEAAVSTLWNQLRNRNYLAELQVVLVCALIAGGILAVANLVDIATGAPITVTVAAGASADPSTVDGLRPDVRLSPTEQVDLIVDNPSAPQIIWHTAQTLPWFLIAMVMLTMLLLIVRTARRDDPFAARNVRRLAVIGWTMTVGGGLAFMVELFARLALSDTVSTAPPQTGADFPITWLFGGLCFLALAEVVKRGCAIRTELAGVI